MAIFIPRRLILSYLIKLKFLLPGESFMHKFSNNALWNNPDLLIGNMYDLYLFYCLKHVIEQNHNEELIFPKKFN